MFEDLTGHVIRSRWLYARMGGEVDGYFEEQIISKRNKDVVYYKGNSPTKSALNWNL